MEWSPVEMKRLVETPADLVYTLLKDQRETDTCEIPVEVVSVIASASGLYPAVGNLLIDLPGVVAERAVLRSLKTKSLYRTPLFAVYPAPYQAVFS
jgi:hypothetical protein